MHGPAVAAGKEPVLSNGFERLPMPNYGHERGGERGIEQEAMSEGRVRVGVWLTRGHNGEQKAHRPTARTRSHGQNKLCEVRKSRFRSG